MARKKYNGEGSIYQRQSDLRWVGSIVLGRNQKGKLVRKVFYGKSGAEVSEKIKDFYKKNPIVDTYIDSKKITLEEWMESWFDSVVAPKVKENTLESYKAISKKHIYPILGKLKISTITHLQIREFLVQKAEYGLSLRYREYLYTVLSQALKHAAIDQVIFSNPCQLVKKPRPIQLKKDPPTPEIAMAIIKQVEGTRYEPIFKIAWEIGARRGEILALRSDDLYYIDKSKAGISITKATYIANKTVKIGIPKTHSSFRVAVVSKKFIEEIKRLTKNREGLLFPNESGGLLWPNDVTKVFKEATKSAGYPQFNFHDFRHAHAHDLLKNKVGMEVVQNRLGHSSIDMTIRRYGHIKTEFQNDIPRIMARITTEASKKM